MGLYTKVADTDVITPLASCDADGCQSKMLSWFFQRLGSVRGSRLKCPPWMSKLCIFILVPVLMD